MAALADQLGQHPVVRAAVGADLERLLRALPGAEVAAAREWLTPADGGSA